MATTYYPTTNQIEDALAQQQAATTSGTSPFGSLPPPPTGGGTHTTISPGSITTSIPGLTTIVPNYVAFFGTEGLTQPDYDHLYTSYRHIAATYGYALTPAMFHTILRGAIPPEEFQLRIQTVA